MFVTARRAIPRHEGESSRPMTEATVERDSKDEIVKHSRTCGEKTETRRGDASNDSSVHSALITQPKKHATARSLRRAETRSPRSRGVPGPSPRTAKRWRAARAASRKMNNVLSEVFRSERRSEKKRDSIYNFIRLWSQFLDRVAWRSALARRLPKPLCDTQKVSECPSHSVVSSAVCGRLATHVL